MHVHQAAKTAKAQVRDMKSYHWRGKGGCEAQQKTFSASVASMFHKELHIMQRCIAGHAGPACGFDICTLLLCLSSAFFPLQWRLCVCLLFEGQHEAHLYA